MKKHNILFSLILTFMKIGLFTFGGGYAMISLMNSECVEKKKWITHDELTDITVIAESTPGPLPINCATYIGYKQAGFLGAVLTTISVIFPSYVIIYLISLYFSNILEFTIISNAFQGIKIGIGILILNVAIKMYHKMQKKGMPLTIMLCTFTFSLLIHFFNWSFSSIHMILISGLIGYFSFLVGQLKSRKEGADR